MVKKILMLITLHFLITSGFTQESSHQRIGVERKTEWEGRAGFSSSLKQDDWAGMDVFMIDSSFSAELLLQKTWSVLIDLPFSARLAAGMDSAKYTAVALGDLSASVGWTTRLMDSRFNLAANLSMPTGLSATAALEQGLLAPGSGYWTPGLQSSLSWIIDPVVVNVGLGYSCGLPKPTQTGSSWQPGHFSLALHCTEVLSSSTGYTIRISQQASLPIIHNGTWNPDDFSYTVSAGFELWYSVNNVSFRAGIHKNLSAATSTPVLTFSSSYTIHPEETND